VQHASVSVMHIDAALLLLKMHWSRACFCKEQQWLCTAPLVVQFAAT
jgi:hypothetical protein